MPSAIFDAALDLALELGVYNYSTGRVVKFTSDELLMGLRKAPQAVTLGEGKDARTLYARQVCDTRHPLAWAGTPGTPVPEHLFLPMAVSYAQEPLVDMMTCGTLTACRRPDGGDRLAAGDRRHAPGAAIPP